jgi:hypothetical protein
MPDFNDQKYVEVIRKALWCREEFGRAAVMIGSGFSRNAEPAVANPRTMPTWPGLCERLIDRLWPAPPPDSEERKRLNGMAQSTSGALRIAEEFEATFGRQKLEELLAEVVPDQDYKPGHLHRLLLRLPWSDVLTTNYDTLLERASKHVIERRYDVVYTEQDIPCSMRPRIVKLNGSLPSIRPLICTEEDFRTYPHRFGAFVNLAQQVAMENVLCLLGFSGDDPNFLHWTGWVRDHLGQSAPQIYLCGLHPMSDSERHVLRRRNVVPIDLSAVACGATRDIRLRHRLAVEWFLLSLEASRPDPLTWPSRSAPTTPRSPGIPDPIRPAQPSRSQGRPR